MPYEQQGNERMGTPVFYKWIATVFSSLLVLGIIGVFNSNVSLARIDERLRNLEKKWEVTFTANEAKHLTEKVDELKELMQAYIDKHIADHEKFEDGIEERTRIFRGN
jgi:hypothetical protein|tara:strand:- start:1283 stop:1606 length:324 start_codon:yes stop_codon:yes gene_type:complete